MKLFGFDIPGGDTIKDILNVGGNLFNTYNDSSSNDAIANIIKQNEIQKYNDTKAYNDAATAYNSQAMAMAGANSAARSRAAAAAAAARRQNDINAQHAADRAQKFLNKKYKETMAMYAPFRQSATTLLPEMQGSFEGGLGLSNSLLSLLKQPDQMAKLNGSQPASMLGPKLPSYFKGA